MTWQPRAALEQASGWQARLALRFDAGGERTRLAFREHAGPLLVQRPFYPEGPDAGAERTGGAARAGSTAAAPCHAYLIHPPGGVASGDELVLDARVEQGAHALLTMPAATKFYRRAAAGPARVTQRLEARGLIEWLPQESIFYPGAAVDLATDLHLAGPGARCIGWEIGCAGLPASGQTLGSGSLRQRLALWRDGKPLLLERLNVDAAALPARWGLGGHAAFGTALACPAGSADLDCARAALEPHVRHADCADRLLACTLIDDVLVCRGTARRTDQLRQLFVLWWQAVRPRVLARAAVAPRIWAT